MNENESKVENIISEANGKCGAHCPNSGNCDCVRKMCQLSKGHYGQHRCDHGHTW